METGTGQNGSGWQLGRGTSRRLAERLRTSTAGYAQRRRWATVFAVGVAGMLGYHVMLGANGIFSYQAKRAEHQVLAQQISVLEQQNGRLKQHVDRLKSDPNAIEYEAHMRLRYTRPGQVIVLNNDKPEQPGK